MSTGFSEKDGTITINAHTTAGVRKMVVLSHKDATFDPGDSASHVVGANGVEFIAHGQRKPKFTFSLTNGVESTTLRAHVLDAHGNAWPCTITHAFRHPGLGSQVYTYEQAEHGKGGGYKASDAAGLEGDAFEFLAHKVKTSRNGGAYRVTA
jgi:hypothetical protein